MQVAPLLVLRHVSLNPSVGLVEAGKPRWRYGDGRQPSQVHHETTVLSKLGGGLPVKGKDSNGRAPSRHGRLVVYADRAMNAVPAPDDVATETAST